MWPVRLFVLTVAQSESETYADALIKATYHELQASPHWVAAGGANSSLQSGYADAAMIPSTFAQAMQSVFRFRVMSDAHMHGPLGV